MLKTKKKREKKKKKKEGKISKSISVNPLAVSTLSNTRNAENTKRESHQKLLCLLQYSEKSTSIRRTFPTVSTLSNTRKAGEYSDKEESTSKKLKTALILRIRSVYAQCSQVLFSGLSLNLGVKVSSSLGKNTLSA